MRQHKNDDDFGKLRWLNIDQAYLQPSLRAKTGRTDYQNSAQKQHNENVHVPG